MVILMTRSCPPLSKAPQNWKKDAKGLWTCLGCGRSALRVRHRHKAWPTAISLPIYGERSGSRNEMVAMALISPIDAHLRRYKWRMTVYGYVYRPSTIGRGASSRAYNIYLHREILGLAPGEKIEGHHKDDNPLNNQRWNLEKVTRSENERYKYAKNIRTRTLSVVNENC